MFHSLCLRSYARGSVFEGYLLEGPHLRLIVWGDVKRFCILGSVVDDQRLRVYI